VIVSFGEFEENAIGSNCGQFLRSYLARSRGVPLADSYSYHLEEIPAGE
jgi:hypothetical protein